MRLVSALNRAAAAKASVCHFLAADLDLPISGHVRAHNGLGVITIGGNPFAGVGRLGSVSFEKETTASQMRGFTLTIEADNDLCQDAMADVTGRYQGREVIVYGGFVNPDTNALADVPEILDRGLIETMTIKLGAQSGSIDVHCESQMRWTTPPARYTDADQQLRHPGDRFFDRVGRIAGFQGTWGAQGVANDGSASASSSSSTLTNWQRARLHQ